MGRGKPHRATGWLSRLATRLDSHRRAPPQPLDGPRRGPAANGPATALVLLLHGRGADGDDLIRWAPRLARTLPHAAFVAPNAPFTSSAPPYGYEWVRRRSGPRTPEATETGVRAVAPLLDTFIDAELASHGLDDDRLALFGFSQGCMMALHVGLRRPQPCAAILGYSGRLIAAASLPLEIAARPPVLLCHGAFDLNVPIAEQQRAAAALTAAGVSVTTIDRPYLEHALDREGIDAGAALLQRMLAG
jgi:phospholipase/carboxylesterase